MDKPQASQPQPQTEDEVLLSQVERLLGRLRADPAFLLAVRVMLLSDVTGYIHLSYDKGRLMCVKPEPYFKSGTGK